MVDMATRDLIIGNKSTKIALFTVQQSGRNRNLLEMYDLWFYFWL